MQIFRKFISCSTFAAGLVAWSAAFAANPWEPGGSLDACIAATLKERPGVVTGWQQSGGGDATPYMITILNADGINAQTFCDPANATNFQFTNKIGLFRYSMFQRATWPESRGRETAPEVFVGPVRLTSMELSVGLSGRPLYTYRMLLPNKHKASVEIDAVTGKFEKGLVE
jgi:hypothetical protein